MCSSKSALVEMAIAAAAMMLRVSTMDWPAG
jgi:hypothetical protein